MKIKTKTSIIIFMSTFILTSFVFDLLRMHDRIDNNRECERQSGQVCEQRWVPVEAL